MVLCTINFPLCPAPAIIRCFRSTIGHFFSGFRELLAVRNGKKEKLMSHATFY
jgi:hypothetical protein